MPRSRPPSLHHIGRIDLPLKRDHAWVVKIQRCGKIVAKRRFSDGPHGGKRRALQAAMRFRDQAFAQTQEREYGRWRRLRKRSDNTSGTIGVGRYVHNDRRKRQRVKAVFWLAFWNDANGKRRSRRFSVKLYGETRAKALALRARMQAMRTMFP